MEKVFEVIVFAALLSTTIPLTFLLINIRRLQPSFKWLAVYLSLSIGCDIGGQILWQSNMNPNLAGNVWTTFAIVPVSFFFYSIITAPYLKGVLIWVNVFHFAFACYNSFYLQGVMANGYTEIFTGLLILAFCIFYFYKLLHDLPTQQLHSLPLFWITSAFFFSYAGKMMIYAFTQYLVKYMGDNLLVVWAIHNFLSITGNLLMAYGAWLNHKQLRSTSL
jgi:hypothetical protein